MYRDKDVVFICSNKAHLLKVSKMDDLIRRLKVLRIRVVCQLCFQVSLTYCCMVCICVHVCIYFRAVDEWNNRKTAGNGTALSIAR